MKMMGADTGIWEPKMRFLGADLDLNHAAFVTLNEHGDVHDARFVANVKDEVKSGWGKSKGLHIPLAAMKKGTDKQNFRALRLKWWWDALRFIIGTGGITEPLDYAGIEDYAWHKTGEGNLTKAELGGIARILLMNKGVRQRYHDPISVKMFSTHIGTADGEEVRTAVIKRWWPELETLQLRDQTTLDLAAACAVARLVWTEYQLRHGEIELRSLHPKEIQVFNRTTKPFPTNILDREWIGAR